MKKLKSIILILIVALCSPLFLACGSKVQIKILKKLSMPTDVQFNETTCIVEWSAVENADFYGVEVNGKIHQSIQTQLDISEFVSQSGEYTIRVVASSFSSEFVDSEYTEAIYLTKKQQWNTPTIFFDESEYTIYWEQVPGVVHYTLIVNDIEFMTTDTSFYIYAVNIYDNVINHYDNNTFAVYCSATSDYLNSDVSNTITVFYDY